MHIFSNVQIMRYNTAELFLLMSCSHASANIASKKACTQGDEDGREGLGVLMSLAQCPSPWNWWYSSPQMK